MNEIKPMTELCLLKDADLKHKNNESQIIYFTAVKVLEKQKEADPLILIGKVTGNSKKKSDEFINFDVSIFNIPNVKSVLNSITAMSKIQQNKELTKKVFPKKCSSKKHTNNIFNEQNSMFCSVSDQFNEKQRQAIYLMTRPVSSTFILFGPPGTGKTTTLVETVHQLFIKYPDKKFLICTPSNMAADSFAEALLKTNFCDIEEIFRFMSSSHDTSARNQKLNSITKITDIKDSQGQTFYSIYDFPDANTLKKYRIIICTLGSVPKLFNRGGLDHGHFSHIFIDEASQSSEMESYLPIGCFATAETRIILAGDPKQLGPVATIECLKAPRYGYKKSLLARLCDDSHFKTNP